LVTAAAVDVVEAAAAGFAPADFAPAAEGAAFTRIRTAAIVTVAATTIT